ncbi:MAG: aspartate aminotransferase family protein [Verrucomicrobiales bacterium]
MLPELKTTIPGPRSLAPAETLRRYESRNVTALNENFPVFWERSEGVNVWDADGNRFLDFTSAFGVAGLGHGRAEIQQALSGQGASLMHAMGDVHPSALKGELCERLSALTFERWGLGEGKTLLGNSGFEAVEAALKTALLATGKPRILTFEGGYHGLGYGTLAAGGLPVFRQPFAAQLAAIGETLPFAECEGADFRPPAEAPAEALSGEVAATVALAEKAFTKGDVGAVLIEPVQGRGGKRVAHPQLLASLRRLCEHFGALLIYDEIFTGFNRTGALFACDHVGIYPHIICLGKALTSGFPLSACVGRGEVMDAWPPSSGEAIHTSTFLGSPLGCAMALASLELHADPALAQRVRRAGSTLRGLLEEIDAPAAGRLRGLGLMLGLCVEDPEIAAGLVPRALEDGLLLLLDAHNHTLSLVPPFDITADELRWGRDRIQEYLMSLPGSIS